MGLRSLFRKAVPEQTPETDHSPPGIAPGPSGWARAALRFDVRSLSKDQLRGLAHELLAGGAISRPDERLLSLDPVTYAPHWPAWPSGGRHDWIAEITARIRKGHPERAYIAYLELLLSFLMRVEAARPPAAAAPVIVAQPRPSAKRLTSPLPRAASF